MTQPEDSPAGESPAAEPASIAPSESQVPHVEPTETRTAGETTGNPAGNPLSLPPEPKRLPHVPKPTILYLMGWTATTAVVLAVLTQLYRVQTEMNTPVWAVLLLALAATVLGWFYFGALLILWHAVRRTLWRLEPGEWLVLILIHCLTSYAGLILLMEGLSLSEIAWKIGGALMLVQLSLVMACAALFQRQRLPWRLLFAMPACVTFLIALGLLVADLLETVVIHLEVLATIIAVGGMMIPFPLCLGLLIAGIIRDAFRREKRHYLHWSGVAMTGVLVLPLTAYVVILMIVMFAGLFQH